MLPLIGFSSVLEAYRGQTGQNLEPCSDAGGYILTGDDLIDEPLPPSYWACHSRKPMFMETSVPGLFAAGDVRHNSVKRCATAVGDGATAASMVHRFLALKS
jgi:thioredoxin reductase (NADPH)